MIILFIIAQVWSKLTFNNNDTEFGIANFGHIPYGQTEGGYLVLPQEFEDNGYDLCNSTNLIKPQYDTSIWLIARRGNCTFTTKAITAQTLGARMLVVVDNTDEYTSGMVMLDDGKGFKVHITSIIIAQIDGEDLIVQLEYNKQIQGLIGFNDSQRVSIPNVVLALTLENRETFRFLRNFRPYYEQLNGSCNFNISYEVRENPLGKKSNFTTQLVDSLGGGRYYVEHAQGQGQYILKEYVRQLCLWNTSQSEWFNYMDYFDQNCDNPKQYENCLRDWASSKIAKQVQDCYAKSFVDDDDDEGNDSTLPQELKQNRLLNNSLLITNMGGVLFYPGVIVNYRPFRGNLEADAVTEDICSSMSNPAQVCLSSGSSEEQSSSGIHIGMIVFVLIVLLLFGIFLFYCYRRHIKQKHKEELGQQVNEMVSQYIKFYETKQQ